VPLTLTPPGEGNVNVEALLVAGFMASLNVALIITAFGQTPVAPLEGVGRVTVGGTVAGLMAPFTSESPHPIVRLINKMARKQMM